MLRGRRDLGGLRLHSWAQLGCGSDPGHAGLLLPGACWAQALPWVRFALRAGAGVCVGTPGWEQVWEHCSPGPGTGMHFTGPPACEQGVPAVRGTAGLNQQGWCLGSERGLHSSSEASPALVSRAGGHLGDDTRACSPVMRMGQDRGQVPSCEQALGQTQVGLQLSIPGGEGENGSFWSPSHTLSPVPGIFHGPSQHSLSLTP